jgi:Cft2 family RNA processing exonuclease
VLFAYRLGIETEEIQLLALEAEEQLGTETTPALEDPLHELRGQLAAANDELREARAGVKDLRRQLKAGQKTIESLGKERPRTADGTRAKAGSAQKALADERARAERLEAEKASLEATLEAERDALADERARADEAESRAEELDSELAQAGLVEEERARAERLERERAEALETISALNRRVEELESKAAEPPSPTDARSLVRLLDSAVAGLVRDAAERLSTGEATAEDRLLLSFASSFVEFKLELPQEGTAVPGDAPAPAPEAPPARAAEPVAPDPIPTPVVEDPDEEPLRTKRRRLRQGWTARPLGGAGEVGASAIVAASPGGESVLLDAGQRVKGVYGGDSGYQFHYAVMGEELSAILVSHAHVDHTGSLPVLHRNQVQQQKRPIPVYMSDPTRALAEIMMLDSAKLQHYREHALRELGESDLDPKMLARPAYDDADVHRVLEAVETVDPYEPFEIPGTEIRAELLLVSHVLGSCAIRLTDGDDGASMLYTGDLGPLTDPQLTLPEFNGTELIPASDLVVMESTHGRLPEHLNVPAGRRRTKSYRQLQLERLYALASAAIKRGGFVLLPCFSLGRAQEFVRIIDGARGKELPDAPIYIGGMGERILHVYSTYAHRGRRGEGWRWVRSGQFPVTQSLHEWLDDSLSFEAIVGDLLSEFEPGYILATPTTLTGGWALSFALQMIDDPRHAICLTGLLPVDDRTQQRLSDLKTGDFFPLADGRRPITCAWDKVGISVHAQADDLRRFARELAEKGEATSFVFVHGIPEAERALAADVERLDGVAAARPLMNNQAWTAPR